MHDFTWAELGGRIRDRRIEKGLSQQALADKAGVTQAGLARIETGQTNPQLETLRQIAAALDTSVRRLLTGNAVENEPHIHPLIRRISRVLDSGDLAATETIAHAVHTAEMLLDRGGRVVARFGSERASGENRKQADDERLRKLIRASGWEPPVTAAVEARSTSPGRYQPIRAGSRPVQPHGPGNPVTKARKAFRAGE